MAQILILEWGWYKDPLWIEKSHSGFARWLKINVRLFSSK